MILNIPKLGRGSTNMILLGFLVLNSLCYGVMSDGVSSVSAQSSQVSFVSFLTCGVDSHPVNCVKEKAGRMLDGLEDKLNGEVQKWGADADQEVSSSGRQFSEGEEAPSAAAHKVQLALNELISILQKSLYRSMARKKGGGGGGIESITISAGQQEGHDKKKKMKKKKKKPADLHIHQHQDKPEMMEEEDDKGVKAPAELAWSPVDEKELGGAAKPRIKRGGDLDDDDESEEGRDLEDGRGKKKKKKKAILKLLLLGAVLKAKIGLLLQLLSAHLQVKFFAIALAGLALNIARFWLDLKKGHQPQKVIYYEHAQHQHHYEHDDQDQGWGGYWSRSINGNDQTKKKDTAAYGEAGASGSSSSGDGLAYSGWLGRSDDASKTQRRK